MSEEFKWCMYRTSTYIFENPGKREIGLQSTSSLHVITKRLSVWESLLVYLY
jgi:hypothetical protein